MPYKDTLDELLVMSAAEVLKIVQDAYVFYTEEEELTDEVAQIRALEEVHLWYVGNKEKKNSLLHSLKEWSEKR